MLEINVKITVAPGEQYTPVESAVIEALQAANSIGTTQSTEATIKPEPTAAPAEEPAAAPAPRKAPAKRAPAKASTTQAAVLEDPEPTPEPVEDDDDPLGGGDEVEYSEEELVTRATGVSKEKDGRAKLKAALAKVNADHGTAYKTVRDITDADARRTFMSELG